MQGKYYLKGKPIFKSNDTPQGVVIQIMSHGDLTFKDNVTLEAHWLQCKEKVQILSLCNSTFKDNAALKVHRPQRMEKYH